MNRDLLQEEYLSLLSKKKFDGFENIDLTKVLYLESIYVQDRRDIISTLKGILSSIFFMPLHISFNIEDNDILFVDRVYNRPDHAMYWKRYMDLFAQKDTIRVGKEKQKLRYYLSKVDIRIVRSIDLFFKYKKNLTGIKNRFDKINLAVDLVLARKIVEMINKKNLKSKLVLVYFDSNFFENILIQVLRERGAISITNQHGQPVFIDEHSNRENQSQLFNLTADYFVAKGEFTSEQLIKSGVSAERIKILGGLKSGDTFACRKDKLFGVFLDTPSYDFAIEQNKKLLRMASCVATELNYKFFVKLHPVDNADRYSDDIELENTIGVYRNEISLNDLIDSMAFGLLHASSVYVDIILRGRKAYKFISDVTYKTVEQEDDQFKDDKELIDKYQKWDLLSDEEQSDYLSKVKNRYIINEDFANNIRAFTNELINKY